MAPSRDGIRRAAQALLIAATSPLATRCGEAAETGAAAGGPGSRSAIAPSAPLDDQDRRLMLRERLRASLGDRYDAPVPKATESDLQRGAKLWHLLCAGCHARDARGRGSLPQMLPVQPGDLTDPQRAAFFSEPAQIRIVKEGIEGTPMFGWKDVLEAEDLRAVVAYLRTLVVRPEEGS